MLLNVKTKRIITTDDLRLYCDPALTFEAVGHIPGPAHNALLEWSEAGYPADKIEALVPQLFTSVSENGTSYPISTPADAAELRQALGDTFMRDLIEGFWNYDWRFFRQRKNASANSSETLDTGSDLEIT